MILKNSGDKLTQKRKFKREKEKNKEGQRAGMENYNLILAKLLHPSHQLNLMIMQC